MAKRSKAENAAAERFGQILRELRTDKGLAAKVVGSLVDLNTDTILKYERGEREPSILTLIKFSHLFGISMDRLLMGSNQEPKILSLVSIDQLKKMVVTRDEDGDVAYVGPERRYGISGKHKGRDRRNK